MRLFVGVEITDGAALEAVKRFQGDAGIAARPVRAENLHFTLQFLGEVGEKRAAGLADALRGVRFSGFDVSLRGTGAFPGPRRPRIVWVGTDGPGGRHLARLAADVGMALAPLGFAPDREFVPHVTVFRVKKKIGDIGGMLAKFSTADFGTERVCRFKLKESVRGPAGPAYADLAEVAAE